jgi:hypothetical protein
MTRNIANTLSKCAYGNADSAVSKTPYIDQSGRAGFPPSIFLWPWPQNSGHFVRSFLRSVWPWLIPIKDLCRLKGQFVLESAMLFDSSLPGIYVAAMRAVVDRCGGLDTIAHMPNRDLTGR